MDRENLQLEEAIRSLHQQMDDDPTSEKPLDALIQVEEALRSMLEVKELSKETKAEIDRVLMGLTGRTISAFLDEIHERAFRVMKSNSIEAKENIEGYLEKLRIVYRKVEKVILYPDERNGIVAGSGEGIEKKELHTNKLQHLLELLRANEIYTDDICVVVGENTSNMMREGSYLYIEIPKVKRTILLHLGYGEASFVLYDIYDRTMVFDMTKEGIQEQLGAAKVEYTEKDLMNWMTEMLKALKLNETVVQPKINIENYDKRLFYIEEIKKKCPTPEEFMAMSQNQRINFKIQSNGIFAIIKLITGKSNLNPRSRIRDMALLAREIYGHGHDVIECELWDRKKWIEEIKKIYKTPEEFLALKESLKLSFRLKGKGLKYLATQISGNTDLNPVSSIQDMAFLAREIYGTGITCIEEILKNDITKGWSKEKWIIEIKKLFPTPVDFIKLDKEQKKNFKLYGKGLSKLATLLLGVPGLNPPNLLKDFALLAREIYGQGHDVIECELWSREIWIEKIKKEFPTAEQFMALKGEKKENFVLFGKGIKFLSSLITGNSDINPIASNKDWALFARDIYSGRNICVEERLKDDETVNWSKEKWIEEIKKVFSTPEEFMKLRNQKKDFKLYGKGLAKLATLILGKTGFDPRGNLKKLAIFAREIYGEGYDVIECELWTRERWIEEIKKRYPMPDEFMALTQNQKESFELISKGLKTLATIITRTVTVNPIFIIRDLAILAREIYGEGYDVIECELWTRERWIEEIKKRYPTPDEFMALTQIQKQNFKLYGKGLKMLTTIIKSKVDLNPISLIRDMALLAREIYGHGHDVIECELWSRERWIEEVRKNFLTKADLLILNQRQRISFKLNKKGLSKLATIITGKTNIDPIASTQDMKYFADFVYLDPKISEN